MLIRWIGQSGYVIKSGNTEIIIDPYLSDAVNRIAGRARLVEAPFTPESINADAVVCTHKHIDHLDCDAVAKMPKGTRFITTEEGAAALKEHGQENTQTLKEGESIEIGDIRLTAVFADHTVEAFGLIVNAEGVTLYFSGDTLYNEKLFEIAEYRPDITFICINGKLGNMNWQEAAKTAIKIGARINIPNHYGMFASNTEDPLPFLREVPGGKALEFNTEYSINSLFL